MGNFGYWGWHSVYKLALRDNWIQNSEGDSRKGVFDLVKVGWKLGKVGGAEMAKGLEKIKIDENNKVWLIVAKGDKAVYLMPVVRNAEWWGENSYCSVSAGKETAEAEVNGKGIANINGWKFDRKKEWKNNQNERLKNLMGSGFSITRKLVTDNWDWQQQWWERELMKEFENGGKLGKEGKWVRMAGIRTKQKLYKNAGVLSFTQTGSETVKCDEVEHYFPLDLVVLGNSKETIQTEIKNANREQTITISDKISDVTGVNH